MKIYKSKWTKMHENFNDSIVCYKVKEEEEEADEEAVEGDLEDEDDQIEV